jgi:hypothetical protein
MARPRCVLAILTISLLSCSGFAQQQAQKGSGTAQEPVAASTSEGELVAQQRKLAVLRVSGFSEELLALNNVQIKAQALARLADLLWKEDEPQARRLLSKALDLSAPQSGATAAETQELGRARRAILNIIARRDVAWAKRVIDADSADRTNEGRADERMSTNFNAAYDLLKTAPDKSIEFAERSLRGGVPEGIHSLLILLRLKDEKAANTLFLKSLEQLLAQPAVSADALLELGTYIFTSPGFDPNDSSIPPDMTRVVGVGRLLVYDITADRPNIPPPLVRAYLETAAKILTRPIPADSRAGFYAAAHLLLPKTLKFAPELTQPIASAMQALAQDVPQELTLDASYANFEAAPRQELSETIKDIEKEKSEQRRNERYLVLIADLWRRSDFAGARALNAKISDPEASAQLKTLIDFQEAAEKLGRRKELNEAQETARKMPKGIESALLWLGIARALARAGDLQRATEAINAALGAAASVGDARRPYLMLNAAGQLAQLDAQRARTTLAEAVRQINAQTPASLAAISWEQRVETGRMWRSFPVKVAGVETSFRETLPPLIKLDSEGIVQAVKALTDERQRATALLAVAAGMLG